MYYEFKRHVIIPIGATENNFTLVINFEKFARMMPPSFNPKEYENYRLIINSFFTVFKFGSGHITFDCFVKTMNIMCNGTPVDKLPSKSKKQHFLVSG